MMIHEDLEMVINDAATNIQMLFERSLFSDLVWEKLKKKLIHFLHN